jgi:hypothetical protein
MSELTRLWVFQNVREYEMPFEKRCHLTSRTAAELKQVGWAKYV